MFLSVSAFASNLTERNVYGILSENITGATFYNSQSQDNIGIWAESSLGDWTAVAAVEVSSAPAFVLEGRKSWEIVMDRWNEYNSNFQGTYYAVVVFPFITATSRPPEEGAQVEQATDISHFKYLDFWIKPKKGDVTKILVGISDTADRCATLESLGVTNEQTWQHVELDITSLPGVQLSAVKKPFLLKTVNGELDQNTVFYVDNVVLRTDSPSASFKATLKDIESMQNIPSNPDGNIIWKQTAFRNAQWPWQSACQYIELDMDMCSPSWTVTIYSDNGGHGRGGMWAQGTDMEYVVPMCWRAYNGEIGAPQSGKPSYFIKQSTASHSNLYDGLATRGVDTGYYTWFYMKDKADIDFNDAGDLDYITVWDSSLGYHGEVNAVGKGFYAFTKETGEFDNEGNPITVPTVEKKPRIYLGGGFGNAAGGITYIGNIVIKLNNE